MIIVVKIAITDDVRALISAFLISAFYFLSCGGTGEKNLSVKASAVALNP